MIAQDGLARAIYPVHTALDGDVVFAASTAKRALRDPLLGLTSLARLPPTSWPAPSRAACMRRRRSASPGALPDWRQKFSGVATADPAAEQARSGFNLLLKSLPKKK